jgi:hypothetical protein
MSMDTGMIIVIFISIMYLAIVFVLLFYVGNEWCDLLYKNMTVRSALTLNLGLNPFLTFLRWEAIQQKQPS